MQQKSGKFKTNWGGTDLKPGFTVLASLISSSFMRVEKDYNNGWYFVVFQVKINSIFKGYYDVS